MSETRRTFLKHTAVGLTTLTGAAGVAAETPAPPVPARPPLDAAMLRAIGEVALPSELGARGVASLVDEFQQWLDGFEPVAEQDHGYGTDEIRYGPPDPAPRWQAQLEAFELESRRRSGRGYAELAVAERRAMIEREVAREQGGMPDPLRADHIATALIAYYFTSPAAVDLCYRARIGRYACRGLESAPERPASLAPRG